MSEFVYRYDPVEVHPNARPVTPADARRRLEGGNAAFAGLLTGPPGGRVVVYDDLWAPPEPGAAPAQLPFAAVLGCSDARVPIEIIFGQGFNDVFVVRVAGNVLGSECLGSLDFAVSNLTESLKLVVVLGHSRCGAVTAAVDAKLKKAEEPDRIGTLLKLIEPGLTGLDTKLPHPALVEAAVEANARWSLRQLAALPAAKRAVERHQCTFAGAVYDLTTGRVRFLN